MLKNNSNKNFQKTNSKNLAWVYLIIFAPLQTILVLAGNNSNFFWRKVYSRRFNFKIFFGDFTNYLVFCY